MSGSKLRVAHVSMLNAPLESSRGFRNQLQSEWRAAQELKKIDGIEWRTILLAPARHNQRNYVGFSPEVRVIPSAYSNLLLMRLYLWKTVWELTQSYDLVLVRHSIVDPIGSLFGFRFDNVATVHHTNGVRELASSGALLASTIERALMWLNRVERRRAIGVTPELWAYGTGRVKENTSPLVYPNGIDVGTIEVLPERSHLHDLSAIFVASKFYKWHGLEKLIEAARGYEGTKKLDVHLVGLNRPGFDGGSRVTDGEWIHAPT